MPVPNSPAVSLRAIVKSYGDLLAVDHLSLDVRHGEVLGLLGPNGAGKTTTINILCGLLKSDAGEVLIAGRSLAGHTRECRRLLGLCPQHVVIWESLTCLEQLEWTGRLYDLSPSVSRARAQHLVQAFGLAEKQHKLARSLSGGMKRRLNIALALIHDPQVLILDEPQVELDPQSRILVREYIHSLAGDKTVILSTHDMDEADRLADRIAIIDHGRLLVLDTPDALKKRIGAGDVLEIRIPAGQEDRVPYLHSALPGGLRRLAYHHGILHLVGVDAPDVLLPLLECIRAAGLEIEDMTIRKKTLEDVFVTLTGRRLRE